MVSSKPQGMSVAEAGPQGPSAQHCVAKHKFTGWGRAGGFILTLHSCCCVAAWVLAFQNWTGHKSPNWRVVLIDYCLLEAAYFLQKCYCLLLFHKLLQYSTQCGLSKAQFILSTDIRSHCKGQHQSLHSLSDEWPYEVFSASMMWFFGQVWSHDKDSLKALYLYESNWAVTQNKRG